MIQLLRTGRTPRLTMLVGRGPGLCTHIYSFCASMGDSLKSLPSCNEVGFFQEGAPEGHPTLVTRLVQPPYDERQCTYMFPEAFPQNGPLPVPRVDQTNKAYDGWFVQTDHLFFADGHRASLFSLLTRCTACGPPIYQL